MQGLKKLGVKQGYAPKRTLTTRIIQGFWEIDQSIDSPQVHTFMRLQKERKCRIYAGFRSFCVF